MVGYVASAGIIGLLCPLGAVAGRSDSPPERVNVDPNFIHFAGAFQNWPAVLFLVVGAVMVLQQLGAVEGSSFPAVPVFGVCALALAATISVLFVGPIPTYIERVSGTAARELAERSKTSPEEQRSLPPRASSAASQLTTPPILTGPDEPERFPVTTRRVVFVLVPVQGTAEGDPQKCEMLLVT